MKTFFFIFFFLNLNTALAVPSDWRDWKVWKGKDLVTGKVSTLQEHLSNPYAVVVFVSARCPCSEAHEKELQKLTKEFSAKGFSFVGVHSNADEDEPLAQKHFSSASLPFPVFQDKAAELANAFGALKTPHVFVFNSVTGEMKFQGGVDNASTGEPSEHFLRDALTALSEGQKPKREQARALGCVIKRPST